MYFLAISKVEAYIVSQGFQRVETIVKVDHRVDLENNVERKLKAIGEA